MGLLYLFYFSVIQAQIRQICDAVHTDTKESVTVFGCRKFYMWEFRENRLSDSDSLLWCINVCLTMLLMFFDRFWRNSVLEFFRPLTC